MLILVVAMQESLLRHRFLDASMLTVSQEQMQGSACVAYVLTRRRHKGTLFVLADSYRASILKAFTKTVEEGRFPFVILDAPNIQVEEFRPFYMAAQVSNVST